MRPLKRCPGPHGVRWQCRRRCRRAGAPQRPARLAPGPRCRSGRARGPDAGPRPVLQTSSIERPELVAYPDCYAARGVLSFVLSRILKLRRALVVWDSQRAAANTAPRVQGLPPMRADTEGHHMTATYASSFDAPPLTPRDAAPRIRKSLARRLGLLYWLAVLPAPFALLYVPNRVFVPGDASSTADRIRASAVLLRMGMMVELWNCVLLIFVGFGSSRGERSRFDPTSSQNGLASPSSSRVSDMWRLLSLRSRLRSSPAR